jgi:hypothetical protein
MDDTVGGYSRRDFLRLSGKGIVAAGIASLVLPQLSGCSSSHAATDFDYWQAVRLNDFTLSSEYLYLNNSTFGTTLNAVRKRMAEVGDILARRR